MVDRMISPFTLTAGPVLFTLAMALLSSYTTWSGYLVSLAVYFLWILFSRTMRMLPHFWRVPGAQHTYTEPTSLLAAAFMHAVMLDMHLQWHVEVPVVLNSRQRHTCFA